MLAMCLPVLTLVNVPSQMLKSVGAGGHYPTNKLQAEDADSAANAEVQKSWLTSLVDRTVGRVQALAETAIFAFYKVTHCRHPCISNLSATHFLHPVEKDLNTDLAYVAVQSKLGLHRNGV